MDINNVAAEGMRARARKRRKEARTMRSTQLVEMEKKEKKMEMEMQERARQEKIVLFNQYALLTYACTRFATTTTTAVSKERRAVSCFPSSCDNRWRSFVYESTGQFPPRAISARVIRDVKGTYVFQQWMTRSETSSESEARRGGGDYRQDGYQLTHP